MDVCFVCVYVSMRVCVYLTGVRLGGVILEAPLTYVLSLSRSLHLYSSPSPRSMFVMCVWTRCVYDVVVSNIPTW